MIEAEQAVRDTESALLVSEARSLALSGELATVSDKICSLDKDVCQLSFALAIANASAASREVLCSQILGVAAGAVSLADEVLRRRSDTSGRQSELSVVIAVASRRLSRQL